MKRKLFILLIILLFGCYLVIFISSESGYYFYSNRKKADITDEMIKQFEKDVAENKDVNINDYISYEKKDYTNNITDIGDGISNLLIKTVDFTINESYKIMEKMVN